MKMAKEHVEILKTGIDKVLAKYPNIAVKYESGDFPRSEKVKDLQKRFCFDLFFATGIRIGDAIGVVGDINGDYDDSHIFTALKSVCPKIERKF